MIDAGWLARCSDAQSVAELMKAIGYPASVVPIVTEEWERIGIECTFLPQSRLSHLCRLSTVHLFVLESENQERESCAKFIRCYSDINCIVKPVILNIVPSGGVLTIYAGTPTGRLRAREISLSLPRARDVEAFNMIELGGEVETPDRLFDRALDRGRLCREFFRRFRQAWHALRNELSSQFILEPDDEISSQALLVLSRILFLYFIQEKGWLDGNRRFIVDNFHSAVAIGDEFFATRLSRLFFGCLNRPRELRDAEAVQLGEIPYLNGGLFDRSAFEKRHMDIRISNTLMSQVIEDLFERFSFSAEEGEEEDAHIDPEMLGKVFESLMAGDERLASGSFYTPREIVDRLTSDSILRWLVAGNDDLLESLDATGGGELGAAVTPQLAAELIDRIGSIRIIDPACGSGAFLLSAVRVIESLIRRLSRRAGISEGDRLRQRIVERSIHGVDLKPEAVHLCELRLWLAIVSESDEEITAIPPLPNLDRNILQGSALLGPLDFLGDGRGEIYREWSYALRARADMLEHYRRCSSDAKPRLARALREADVSLATALLEKAIAADEVELRLPDAQASLPAVDRVHDTRGFRARQEQLCRRIDELKTELAKVQRGEMGFFSFEVHFSQVMCEGGFDLVIGNPPWVRSSRIPAPMRGMLNQRYRFFRPSAKGFSQPDLAVAFCEKAIQVARSGGIVSLLLPAKIATATYASRLRSALIAETELMSVHDWSHKAKELFDADTFPMSLMLRKGAGASRVQVCTDGERYSLDQAALPVDGCGSPWSLVPPELRPVMDRMRHEHPTLAENLGRNPVMGVKTGANRKFLLDDLVLNPSGMMFSPSLEVELPRSAVCRTVRGRDLCSWRAGASTWMLWPPMNGWSEQCAWVDVLARSLAMERRDIRLAWVRAEHLGTKVAWKDVSRGLQAAVMPATTWVDGMEFPLIPNQTLYSIDTASMEEAHLLAAILNSTVARALTLATAERAKDRHFRFFGSLIAGLPLPRLESESAARHALIRLARQAEAGADVREALDIVSMQAYGLEADEMELLSRFQRTKTGRDDSR